jgi:hypothetical protein
MSEYRFGHEELGPTPLLRDALIAATFDTHRALDPSVEKLRLYDVSNPGQYNLRAEVEDPLRVATFHGPPKLQKEHGMIVAVTAAGKLAVPTNYTVGTEIQVEPQMSYFGGVVTVAGERIHIQDRYMAALPHTHPEESPPSTTDLGSLFYDSEEPTANTAAWVITESGTYIIFRGVNTPEWPKGQCDAKVAVWASMVKFRMRQNIRPGMSEGEINLIEYRAQMAFLRQAAEKYDLQVFTGTRDVAELSRL